MDRVWWNIYYDEVRTSFKGRLVTISDWGKTTEKFTGEAGRNSGAGALCVAAQWGAKRIIMIGYDCQYAPDGKRHWHGDHPSQIGNAKHINKWPAQFRAVAGQLISAEVINCSRETALDMFKRIPLEEALRC